MDISGGVDAEQRNIIVWNKHGKINQQWDIIYADEWPEEPKKGEMNTDFGLYVERDFYIVSQMNDHRYLDVIPNKVGGMKNVVIKTRNGRGTQKWYFHQQSKTIRNRDRDGQGLDIILKNNARYGERTNHLRVAGTNSGW